MVGDLALLDVFNDLKNFLRGRVFEEGHQALAVVLVLISSDVDVEINDF